MPIVNIENLDSYGIVTDEPSYNLPPEAFSDGLNVAFADGKVSKRKGETAVYGTPSIDPYFLMSWQRISAAVWFYAGTAQIYKVENNVHSNVTRYTTAQGDDDYNAGSTPFWSGGILHGVPILNHNNQVDAPQQWTDADTRFKDLDNWPASTYCQIIRPYKNFLVALDITKSAVRYPYTVKWSQPADPGTVPTSWDEADATKLAGEYPLSQTGGFIVDCAPLAGVNVIYKTDAIWDMRPTGGLDVFRFTPLSQTTGMLTRGCVTELQRQHFIVGGDDIYMFDGARPQTLVDRRMRNWFFTNLSSAHYEQTVVVANRPKQEIWVCFVEDGAPSGMLTKALVWDWGNNTWTVKDLPELSYTALGAVQTDSIAFDATSGAFDSDFGTFGDIQLTGGYTDLLHARTGSSKALLHAEQGYTAEGSTYRSYVERVGLGIVGTDRQGRPKSDITSRKFIRAIYPKIQSSTPVTLKISVGVQEHVDGPITWSSPQSFNNSTDSRVGFAMNGKLFAVRFEETSSEPWSLLGYSVDLDVIGNL